ncbi:hypothetical protein [Streptococcus macacae]|uniref:Uncharacterized protein n=1 Tax=Streptococcus macacae NCTC 11558 TaxID=764298 RepID=G5JYU5_9STRE|nr:hypothetical protein [Streptococcus macacae]EHJ51523.1 hypothetical protein STRMA_0359 [Streptococcus macacae NCTC 11558]SUN78202.1 Uncharacterised protein [Streptococcus macacae NCTC 11558]
MTANKKHHKVLWIVLDSLLGVIILIAGVIGGKIYMDHKKMEHLYQHGFRLLEEQTALYVKEHYSGVKKIEFSPIFKDGGGGFTQLTLTVVPVIYDKDGHRAYLGGTVGNTVYSSYGYPTDFYALEIGSYGEEIIDLAASNNGDYVEVSHDKTLPKKAKLDSAEGIDDNIDALVKNGQLNIKKQKDGSPHAKITYNTEIKKGDYKKWR